MKYVRTLTPTQPYDAAGTESWLAHMARRGLHLKRFRPLFCTFSKGEPQQVRYRLEPCRRGLDEELPQRMLELYEEFGWEYVDEANRSILIFRTADPQAPEPHSDPELQVGGWRKLYRSYRNNFLSDLLLAVMLSVFTAWMLLGDGMPVFAFLTTSLPLLLLLWVWSLCQLPPAYRDMSILAGMVERLRSGEPLEHRGTYPRRRPWALLGFLLSVVLLLVLIAGHYIYPLTGGGARNLDQFDAFPLLSLSHLEGEDFQPDSFVVDGVDYSNFFRRERSILCPDQWEVIQSGDGPSSGLWVRLEIRRYDSLLPLLSASLARELLEEAMGLDENIWWAAPEDQERSWTITRYPDRGLDYLAVVREEGGLFQAAAASLDGRTVVVRYTGHGELSDHLEEITAMVGD